MRKLTLFVLLAVLLSQNPTQAQNRDYPDAIHAKINLIDYGVLFDQEFRPGQGFEVGYFRNLAPFLNVGLPLKLGLAKLPGINDNTVTASADLVFHLGNMRGDAFVSPYAMAGGGYFTEAFDKGHFQFPFGAGLNFRLSRYAFINVQGEFRKALADDRDNIQIGAGFVFLLHKPEPKVQLPPDRDGDGVPDHLDRCPDLAGPASALGCPDRDGDGVPDTDDRCPDDPGPIETDGCPDYDNDGFPDHEDECPTEPGTWKGCPDRDFDGVPDKDDKCPDIPGPASNMGCPEKIVQDRDGDGFPDDEDDCPDTPGTIRGCPDRDGDGVPDHLDKCPDTPGIAANNGCPEQKIERPDRDGDGVPDDEDPCPDKAGPYGGCPDSDGDGVPDHLDKCPNTPGIAANDGCPEVKEEVRQKLASATRAVQFDTGRATLKGPSFAVLDEVVDIMRQNPSYVLSISGHTDNVGSDEQNLKLSKERAKTCYDYLIFRGIRAERLRHNGFGPYRPIADNRIPEGRELNRRVEFELLFD